jgi:hypothetical protein
LCGVIGFNPLSDNIATIGLNGDKNAKDNTLKRAIINKYFLSVLSEGVLLS